MKRLLLLAGALALLAVTIYVLRVETLRDAPTEPVARSTLSPLAPSSTVYDAQSDERLHPRAAVVPAEAAADEQSIQTVVDWMQDLPGGGVEAASAATRLGAQMRNDAGLIGAVEVLLRRSAPRPSVREQAALVAGLEAAGNSRAQRALCAVARDTSLAPSERAVAVAALNGIRHPTSGTVNDLEALVMVDEPSLIRSTATLALATLSGRQHSDAELGDRIHLAADGAIHRALVEEPARALTAMGNRAEPGDRVLAEPYLTSDDPEVRRAAVTALRRQPPQARVRLLEPRLRTETDPRCLQAIGTDLRGAIEAAPTEVQTRIVEVAGKALLRTEARHARLALIDLLGAVSDDEEARGALLQLFWQSPPPEIRRAIGRYVSASELAAARPPM